VLSWFFLECGVCRGLFVEEWQKLLRLLSVALEVVVVGVVESQSEAPSLLSCSLEICM
jgi:hypothetical protein